MASSLIVSTFLLYHLARTSDRPSMDTHSTSKHFLSISLQLFQTQSPSLTLWKKTISGTQYICQASIVLSCHKKQEAGKDVASNFKKHILSIYCVQKTMVMMGEVTEFR